MTNPDSGLGHDELSRQTPGGGETHPAAEEKYSESFTLKPLTFVIFGIGLVLMIVIIHLFAATLLAFSPPKISAGGVTEIPPQPRLQTAPEQDMAALKSTETTLLGSYGWVDKQAGVARMPVNQAMQALATQGFQGVLPTPGPQATLSPQAAGAKAFQDLGCNACHGNQSTTLAPTLHGLFGQPVALTNGQTVTADEAYIRESILQPQAKIVAGYGPIMPSFQGRVNDQQLAELVTYIQSIGPK